MVWPLRGTLGNGLPASKMTWNGVLREVEGIRKRRYLETGGGGGHSLGDVVTRVNGLEKGQCRAILENEAAEWTPALPGWCPHGTPGAHELGKRLLDSNLWEKRPFILQIT